MEQKLKRIGIMGGTFDPVHCGHLIVAETVREKFCLDKVIFIPSGTPPHKDTTRVTDAEHRYNMVRAAIHTNAHFEASRIEIDRHGYTYTVDTLTQLKAAYGEKTQLFFIIGADVVKELLTWKDYEKVFGMCEFIAVLRPGHTAADFDTEIKSLEKKFAAKINKIETLLVEISSTDIRNRAASHMSFKYLVPDAVERYILDNGFYNMH